MTERTIGINVEAIIDEAVSKLEDLVGAFDRIPDSTTATLTADDTDLLNKAQESLTVLDYLDQHAATAYLLAEDHIPEEVETALDYLGQIDGYTVYADLQVEGLADIPDASTDAMDGIDGVGQSAEEAKGPVEELADGIVGLVASMIGLQLGSDSLNIGKNLESSLTYWGLSGKEADDYRSKMEDINDVLRAPGMGDVQLSGGWTRLAQLDVDPDSALAQMPHYATMAKRTQTDLNTDITRGTTILRRWNLEGENANEFLDDLSVAMQRSTMGATGFLSTFEKMGSGLTGFNLAPESLIGMITSLEHGGATQREISMAFRSAQSMKPFKENLEGTGAGAEKAAAAMEELGVQTVYNADGSVNYGATLVAVTDALGTVTDDTKRTELATAIFGDRVGLTFAKLEGKPSDYAKEVEAESESLNKDLGTIAKDHRSAQGWIEQFYNTIVSKLSELPTWIQMPLALIAGILGSGLVVKTFQKFKGLLEDPIGAVRGLGEWLGKLPTSVDEAKGAILGKLSSLWDDITWFLFKKPPSEQTGIVKWITDWFAGQGSKEAAEEAGKGLGGRILDGIRKVLPDSVDDILKSIFKGGGKGAGAGMLFTTEDLPGTPKGEKGSAQRESWIQEQLTSGQWQNLGFKSKEEFMNWAREYNTTWDTLQLRWREANDGWNWLVSQVSGWKLPPMPSLKWEDVMNFFGLDNISLDVLGTVEWLLSTIGLDISITNLLKVLWEDIFDWISLESTTKWIKDKINQFIIDLWNAPGKLYDVGKAMMENLVQGLLDKFPSLESALAWVSDHFPKSPPKIGPLAMVTPATMQEYGSNLATGLEEGVDSYVTPEVQPMSFDNYEVPDAIKAWYDTASRTVSSSLGDTGGGGYGRSIGEDQSRVRGATDQFSNSSSGMEALNKADATATQADQTMNKVSGIIKNMAEQARIAAYYAAPKYEFIKDPAPVIQARRQAMIEQTHYEKYGESMASAQERFRSQYGFIDRNTILAHFPGAKSSGQSYSGFKYSDAYMEAHATPVIHYGYDTHLKSGANWNSAPSRAGAATAAASSMAGSIPSQSVQTIESVPVTVKISDVKIRSDMDIKHIANELGKQIGQQAQQNGIRVVEQMR